MTVRDLGYRPYEGERLPPSHNMDVLLRHGMRRAWGSWLVKIAVFAGWLPMIVAMAFVGLRWFFTRGAPPGQLVEQFDASGFMSGFLGWQLWLFVSMITLGAGASAIAEDKTHLAFQFYFAKPVTAAQYIAGRVAAVAFWCLMLTLIPALLVGLTLVGTAPEPIRAQTAGVLLPTLLHALIISVVTATASVAISSLSSSRALTMSAWILVFLLPHGLGFIVWKIAEWPWLRLLSLPSLLGAVGDALFQVPAEGDIRWYHALPVLLGVMGGGLYLAWHRVRSSEVIT